jgi:hypothetical protein
MLSKQGPSEEHNKGSLRKVKRFFDLNKVNGEISSHSGSSQQSKGS